MKWKSWLALTISIIYLNSNAQLEYVSNDSVSFSKVMFVGDILMNNQMVVEAYDEATNTYNFNDIFYYIQPILNLGDIVTGNLELTIGTAPYGMFPTYRVPEEFAVALKYAGFNLVMNANSKAIYQEEEEWLIQKSSLDKTGIQQTGSFQDEDDKYRRNPVIIEKRGIKTAFVNFMEGIDYVPEVAPLVNAAIEENIKSEILLAKNRGADFVVVYMHWGKQYQSYANVQQQQLAQLCRDAGADLVLGTHPHIVQGFEANETILNGNWVPSLTAYSLGDFLNPVTSTNVSGSYILEIVLCKNRSTGITSVCDYGYIPTYTYTYQKDGKTTYSILPISQIEDGNISANIPSEAYHDMHKASELVRMKLGSSIPEIKYELSDEIVSDVNETLVVTSRPLNESKNFSLKEENLLLASSGFMDANDKSTINSKGLEYKIQFLALRSEIPIDTRYYRHLEGYEVIKEEGYYKYLIGSLPDLKSANDFCLDVKRLGHSRAFVVVYKDGMRVKM